MGKPNYQRILAVHGHLPNQLAQDFGLKILDQKVDSTASAVIVPETPLEIKKPKKVKSVDEKYADLVDENGKKLVEYSWVELRAKAGKDGKFQPENKRVDILEAYSKQ